MKRIPWKVLDKYRTAYEIAALMRTHGIRGVLCSVFMCPLANATQYAVYEYGVAEKFVGGRLFSHKLTEAEKDFFKRFDNGEFPDLVFTAEELDKYYEELL
jgi:hypothetical protein